jgi:small subunit ribosomal protein S7
MSTVTYKKKMTNCFAKQGAKKKAEKVLNITLTEIKQKTKKNPQYVLTNAIKKITPLVQLKKKSKSGKILLVPFELKEKHRHNKPLHWLKNEIKDKKKTLTSELINIPLKKGLIKKKEETITKEMIKSINFERMRWKKK